jgi:hypothetical protein
LLPCWAQSTAGLATGHALIQHANPDTARSRKALQIAMFLGPGTAPESSVIPRASRKRMVQLVLTHHLGADGAEARLRAEVDPDAL